MGKTVRIATARRADAEVAVDLSQWRAWFDGEGGGEGNGQGSDAGTGNDPAKNGNGAQQGQQQSEKTLTQEEADKLIGAARVKGREAAKADLLKELGVEKVDDIKAFIADAKKRADAEKSELDKATEARTAVEKERDQAKADLEVERHTIRLERRDTAIKGALRDAQAKNVDKTFAALVVLKKADVEATLNEDGTVDAKKLTALIDTAKKDYAEDFGTGRFNPGTGSHANGRVTDKTDEDARTANFKRARRRA